MLLAQIPEADLFMFEILQYQTHAVGFSACRHTFFIKLLAFLSEVSKRVVQNKEYSRKESAVVFREVEMYIKCM